MQIRDIEPSDSAKDGVYRALLELKSQKVVSAVGSAGHASVLKMKVFYMEELDTLLCPVNPQQDSRHYIPAHQAEDPEGTFKLRRRALAASASSR